MNTIAIIMAVLMSPLVLYAMTTWWAERKARHLEAQRTLWTGMRRFFPTQSDQQIKAFVDTTPIQLDLPLNGKGGGDDHV